MPTMSMPARILLHVCTTSHATTSCLDAQDDDTIIGWNLFNEPRCNCAPTVIDPNTGAITGENSGSDCANVQQCTADMKVRRFSGRGRSSAIYG